MDNKSHPSKLAKKLLSFFLKGKENSEKLGDLEEGFRIKAKEENSAKAKLWYWGQTITTVPICIKNSIIWGWIMFKNYLKIAFRNISKQKGYSFINIIGLALGIACCIFIFVWVHDELSFDSYNTNLENLYRVEQEFNYNGESFHVNVTPTGAAQQFKDNIPEVINACRVNKGEILLGYNGIKFYESNAVAIDSTFLEMFTIDFIRGDKHTALDQPFNIIISDVIAQKYFGNEDPIGKTLTISSKYDFVVTGVFAEFPHNVSVSFDIAVPFEFSKNAFPYYERGNYLLTYLQLVPGVDITSINQKITDVVHKFDSRARHDVIAAPLADQHLYSYFGFGKPTGAIRYIYMFSIIAIFVLLIACINFMNLATARSANRAKEIGIRKVVGARRKGLINQFYIESLLISVIATAFSIIIVVLLMDQFNEITGKDISLSIFNNGYLITGIIAITLITGLASGSYPAVFLSAFKPASVLSGPKHKGSKNANFRKVLVIIQFTLSVFLIIATMVVYNQMLFIKSKDLGYDKENLIYMEMRGDLTNSYQSIKNKFRNIPGVIGVSAASHSPYRITSNAAGADWDGRDPDKRVLVNMNYVDYNFCKTMGIELVEGRDFSEEFPGDVISDTDTVGGILINEEMAKIMGMDTKSVIGARFDFFSYGKIIGVMKSFHFTTIKSQIEPLAMGLRPQRLKYIIVRLQRGNPHAVIDHMQKSWSSVVTDYPFEYKFLDEDIDNMYKSDSRMLALLEYFAILAIVIACLGLFGLASFMAEQRTKEFGVRKVLGASNYSLVALICMEFFKLVIISNIIAWPVTYYFTQQWLDDFAYKVNIGFTIFLITGFLSLIIALITVGYQALKAANTNPVKSLKYE